MRGRWLRRLLPLLIAALLLCALLFPASGSSIAVYQMAVNERMKPDLTVENMPLLFNGSLYIPYTMLSVQDTGIDLGVRAQYNSSQGILSVSDNARTINFNVKKNAAHASTGETIKARAMVRNSMAYLPVQWLCTYFSAIDYSLTETPYGTLVRLTNKNVILTDREFVDAAVDMLRRNLQNYYDSLATPNPTPTVSLSPTPTVSPSPTQTVSPSPTPTVSSSPSVSPSPTPTTSVAPAPIPAVYLAFRWGVNTAQVAEVLEAAGQYALFLVPVEVLGQEDDTIRRLLGRGHQIGLILEGSDAESCLAQLEQGRQLMADIARSAVLIVAADDLNRFGKAALRDAGCAIWEATLYTDGLNRSGVLTRLDGDRDNYVEITCDAAGRDLTASLLPRLAGDDYHLRLAFAPFL